MDFLSQENFENDDDFFVKRYLEIEVNFFPQSFEMLGKRRYKWFSDEAEKILPFKCVCTL